MTNIKQTIQNTNIRQTIQDDKVFDQPHSGYLTLPSLPKSPAVDEGLNLAKDVAVGCAAVGLASLFGG